MAEIIFVLLKEDIVVLMEVQLLKIFELNALEEKNLILELTHVLLEQLDM